MHAVSSYMHACIHYRCMYAILLMITLANYHTFNLQASQIQNYYRQRGFNADSDMYNTGYAHHMMALDARSQRGRGNAAAAAREFRRGRVRGASRIRPPGPPPYFDY